MGRVVALTGHRPDKIPCSYGTLVAFADTVLTRQRPDVVISGMALGWDWAGAESATRLGVPVHAYIPFPGQESKWPELLQKHYQYLLDNATKVVTVSKGPYAPEKMQIRNQAMVDAADSVLALWNGTRGGTYNCVKYANDDGKAVVNVWDEFSTYIKSRPRPRFSVYSDGSSTGRAVGRGGYAWALVDNATNKIVDVGYGGSKSTTNQRMEMEGAILGVGAAIAHDIFDFELVCDSEYVLKHASGSLKAQANLDLVERLRRLTRTLNPSLRWVKGHSGDEFNDVVDVLAKKGKEEQ